MVRLIAIWVFGILAAAIFGGLVGNFLVRGDGGIFGFIGGACAFVCARLWLAKPSKGMPT